MKNLAWFICINTYFYSVDTEGNEIVGESIAESSAAEADLTGSGIIDLAGSGVIDLTEEPEEGNKYLTILTIDEFYPFIRFLVSADISKQQSETIAVDVK